jgi:putative cardiolipin synthase
MGVIIDGPELAGGLARQFETNIPNKAYLVRLGPDGQGIEWIDTEATGQTTLTTEPGAGAGKRMWIDILEILPIEWLL